MIQVTLQPLEWETGMENRKMGTGIKSCKDNIAMDDSKVHGNFVHKLRSTTTKWVAFKIFS